MPSTNFFFKEHQGANLHCGLWQVDEDSSWVLLLNGYGRPMSDFKGLVRSLNAANINCISLDIRGSGQTSVVDTFTLNDILSDIFFLLECHQVKKLAVLGISMGGLLAQALYFDDRSTSFSFESLILASTCSDTKWLRKDIKVYGQPLEQTEQALSNYFAEIFVAKNAGLITAMAKDIIKNASQDQFGKRGQSDAIRGLDYSKELGSIQSPVTILHGKEDKIIPHGAALQTSKAIANSRLILYENVGHLFIAECPRQFYQDVVDVILSLR